MAAAPESAKIVSLSSIEEGWAHLTIETHAGDRFVFALGRYQLRLLNVMSSCALMIEGPAEPEEQGGAVG